MALDPNVFLRRSWETASRRGCYGPGFVTAQREGDSNTPAPRVGDTKHSRARDRAEEELMRGPTRQLMNGRGAARGRWARGWDTEPTRVIEEVGRLVTSGPRTNESFPFFIFYFIFRFLF
jgi:hypothetical protein